MATTNPFGAIRTTENVEYGGSRATSDAFNASEATGKMLLRQYYIIIDLQQTMFREGSGSSSKIGFKHAFLT